MQVDSLSIHHLQQQNLLNHKSKIPQPQIQNSLSHPQQQSSWKEKHEYTQFEVQRVNCIKSQQCTIMQKEPKRSQHNKNTRSPTQKPIPTTCRSPLMQSIHYSNDLILVYLMYKQQKLSLFLNKGVPFEYLIKKMYKEIQIYEKQTYSISNAIIKNILYKITGFQSIDNDIVYDYELKYKRGNLEVQKFFVPFKQQDHKTPFKIYTRISPNSYGGNQFLARNYSDGEWIIISTIRKSLFDDEKINIIKKSLKNNAIGCSLLLKNSSSNFSQINWLETKHYIIVVSEFFTENLQQNLTKNHTSYQEDKSEQIFVYYAKWLAHTFKQIVSSNVQNFKKISLSNIGLNPSDGQPKISIFDNVLNYIDFAQRRRSVITNGKRASQKIQDNFYFQTYLNLIKCLKNHIKRGERSQHFFNDFICFLEEKNTLTEFTFDLAHKYFSPEDLNTLCGSFQKQKDKHPLIINFTSKLSKIVSNMHTARATSTASDQQTLLISQIKEEVQKLFCMQNMRKNQQRNETKSILQILSSTGFGDLKKQNIGNVAEFKKEQKRKYNLKKKQRMYVQEILNELNQNENFIKTTKENNVASIASYLKKSDEKIKKKMVQKIETKYKKFFERKDTNFEDDAFNSNVSHVTATQECYIEELDGQVGDKLQCNHMILPACGKSRNNILADSHANREQNKIKVTSFLDKQNFATQILSRLEQRNTSFRPMHMSLKAKMNDPSSPTMHKKSSKLEELFINRKNYSKDEKMTLKKKQYGIYLEEAQKQFNKIKMYRKPKVSNNLK